MPIERDDKITPRKFYLDLETIEPIVVFELEECVAQYINDKAKMKEFGIVYEGFDPIAVLDFLKWRQCGIETKYAKFLREKLESLD